ncbi:MAG: hypothetical protein N2Z74_09460 [Syntrophales bacterium]|nr:hypothetical protein [Syntrophales bacterium]
MKPITCLVIVLFVIVSLAHLVRMVWCVPITIADYDIPMWLSIFGFLVPLALAWLLWREHRRPGVGD